MMKALENKLKSQRGASLLLALLFLLICVMVSGSILMAAASNSNKYHSNLEEHQTYLALSSAVSLLCDELSQAEYKGQYKYWEVEQPIYDEEDSEEIVGYKTLRYFQQQTGSYTSALKDVLLKDFDGLFGLEIRNTLDASTFESITTLAETSLTHTLTLSPETGTQLDEREITVSLNVVKESYAIELSATLNDYRLQAELTPVTTKPTLPALTPSDEVQSTAPLRWKVGWITIDGEEEGS